MVTDEMGPVARTVFKKILSDSNIQDRNNYGFGSSIPDFHGDCLLQRAINRGLGFSISEIELVIALTPVDVKNQKGESPLHTVFRNENSSLPSIWQTTKVIDLLVNKFIDSADSYWGVSILAAALNTFLKGFPEISSRSWRKIIEKSDLDQLSPQKLDELKKIAKLIDLNLEEYPRLQSDEYMRARRMETLEKDVSDIKGALNKTMFIRAQNTNSISKKELGA